MIRRSVRFSPTAAGALALAALALVALPAFGAGPAAARPAKPPAAAPARERADSFEAASISVDEVHPGQKGYGLTVFSGAAPERFEVEVVGVMRNVAPGRSYILVKLTGHDLETSGVAAGMSGSPVYLDGRLAGAVAFGWPFSHEAIAGVTPIASMRGMLGVAEGPGSAPVSARPLVALPDLLAGRIPGDLLARELHGLAERFAPEGAGAPGALVWSTSGFGERSLGMLRAALGPVGPSGQATLGAEALAPGGGVSAVLIDGDLRLAATGTVTDRGGDGLLAFGHPFLGFGKIAIPMAAAEVVTVLSNAYNSFKIANFGPVIGAVVEDRQSGIEGRIGAPAPMFPIAIKVHGERAGEYHMRIADVPVLVSSLVGTAALGGLDSASRGGGAQTLDLAARFQLAGHDDLLVEQSFDGDNATGEAVGYLLAVSSYLAQNEIEKVEIRGVTVDFMQESEPHGATIVAVHPERTRVGPGDRVRLKVDLKALRGPVFRREIALDIPRDLGPGHYTVWVGDGASVDAVRLQIAPRAPETLAGALDLLGSFHSRRELRALASLGRPGLAASGEPMPQLPGSVRSLWSGASPSLGAPLSAVVAAEAGERLDQPISGLEKVEIEVRRKGDRDGENPNQESNDDVARLAGRGGNAGAR
ncbi:MAG TPA: SpoIVB peptidase S55 domain-containing protein [Thermoanaerobaculia bacterium]|nr:SpoIVB peptidase S55 domain-containing protein [Thermoanaerobaculia bacterium]